MDPGKFPRGDIRERSVFGGVGGGVPMLFLVILMLIKEILVLQGIQPRPPQLQIRASKG